MGLQRKMGTGIKNPAAAAMRERTTQLWRRERGPCGFGLLPLPHGLGSRRDFAWKKRRERTLAGGP